MYTATLGFEEDMHQIIKLLPKERQTILFSATQTRKVKNSYFICFCISICMHEYIYRYIHTYICIYVYVCIHVYIHISMHIL
jgi:hypothetical protein